MAKIDIAQLEILLENNDKINCVIPVSFIWFPLQHERDLSASRDACIKMVETALQFCWAEFGDKKTGSFGDASCFSF